MDSNVKPNHEVELPMPQAEQTPVANPDVAPNTAPSEIPSQTERQNTELPAAPAPFMPIPVSQPPVVAASQQPTPQPSTSTQALDDTLVAEDSDLIEKEWVLKAKAIVDQTRYDPYRQNKEINRIKADYIKKRYNKDIKVSEE